MGEKTRNICGKLEKINKIKRKREKKNLEKNNQKKKFSCLP